jgi:hypothetical protein
VPDFKASDKRNLNIIKIVYERHSKVDIVLYKKIAPHKLKTLCRFKNTNAVRKI